MSTAQQLDLARARRAALLQRFTPDYPEVVRLDRTIADLVERVQGETPVSATPTPTPLTPAEAAQQKKIQDLKAELGRARLSAGGQPRRGRASQGDHRGVSGQGRRCPDPRVGACRVDAGLQHPAGHL